MAPDQDQKRESSSPSEPLPSRSLTQSQTLRISSAILAGLPSSSDAAMREMVNELTMALRHPALAELTPVEVLDRTVAIGQDRDTVVNEAL